MIGLHMRHQSKLDDGSEDRGEQKCLRHLISTLMPDFTPLSSRSSAIDHGTDNKTTTERRMSASMQQRRRRHLESESSCAKFTSCVILIASDRLHASVRNAAYAKELGCSVVTREDISESVSGRKVKEGGKAAPIQDEHGVHGDSLGVADVELLLRSHVLIGTRGSSYSTLIASLVAAGPLADTSSLLPRQAVRRACNERRMHEFEHLNQSSSGDNPHASHHREAAGDVGSGSSSASSASSGGNNGSGSGHDYARRTTLAEVESRKSSSFGCQAVTCATQPALV